MFNVNVKNATSEKLSDAYKVTRISVLCCISAVLEQMSNKSLFFSNQKGHTRIVKDFGLYNLIHTLNKVDDQSLFQVSKLEKAPATFLFSGLFV